MSNMNLPQVEVSIDGRRLSPSLGYTSSNNVRIIINTCFHEVLENLTTHQRTLTGRFVSLSPPVLIDFSLSSLSNRYIQQLLRDKLVSSHRWLCEDLAADISSEAEELGFGRKGFSLTITIGITYEMAVAMSDPPPDEGSFLRDVLLKLVVLGKIDREFEEYGSRVVVFDLSRQSFWFFFDTWFGHTDELFSCLSWTLSLGVASTEKHMPHVSDCAVQLLILETHADRN